MDFSDTDICFILWTFLILICRFYEYIHSGFKILLLHSIYTLHLLISTCGKCVILNKFNLGLLIIHTPTSMDSNLNTFSVYNMYRWSNGYILILPKNKNTF